MYYAFDRRWLTSTVTVTIVILNIIVFLLTLLFPDTVHDAGVLNVYLVLQEGEYNRLLSAVFLHADFMHLFSNMILLFYLGAVVERNTGHILFALLYLTSGIVGNVITVAYEVSHRESWDSLGASGAVFGVMGAMLVLLFRVPKAQRMGSTLLTRVGFMVAYSLFMGLRSSAVNNVAHVAGLITGALLCLVMTAGKRNIDLRAML
ncbi:MAG: rhomboid family intramembrane serine protease [Lachnospiraceae bacterium]|nr:rhomboid family intramembrane serine protease [Lachnospiraceae bacterium]